MAAKKPESFVIERPFTPCASPDCSLPGRLWLKNLPVDQRVCVNHYYRALEDNYELKDSPDVPRRMPGVVAKPVSGE